MKVTIIGPGLIGGSFALALKKRLEGVVVYGWDQNADHLQEALDLGIIDHMAVSLEEALQKGDWVILAIPVNAIESILPKCLDGLKAHQILVDFGSTKKSICAVADKHTNRASVYSGPSYCGYRIQRSAGGFPWPV